MDQIKAQRYVLPAVIFAGGHHQCQGECGDYDFADGPYGEGAESLFAHFAEVGAQAHSGKRKKESPSGEIGQRGDLIFVKDAVGGDYGDEQKTQDKLGEFLPEEGGFVPYCLGLALAGPVDGVGEDDETDCGVAGGFYQDG